ncbi:MAG: response regulator transcription factor [Acidobacteriota bacterium]
MPTVLIVEDEAHLADGLRFNLEAEGYDVDVVDQGQSALDRLFDTSRHYDAVLLDVMLPDKDGFVVASELREAQHFVPILMLTARGRSDDILRGFESGADDYLSKPFDLEILLARLGGLLRRREWLRNGQRETTDQPQSPLAPPVAASVFTFDSKVIDFSAQQLRVGERILRLTLMETELLRFLVRHEGQTVSRKLILEEVWGLREDTDTRAIDAFVVRLRRYIESDPSQPRHLITVRGVGYRFVAEP